MLGGFVYGTLNRLLIPLGLHHILNNPPWFIFGSYTTASGGETVNGDIAAVPRTATRPPARS